MKKQTLGLITIVVGMLLFSCSNNDAAQSGANMVSPAVETNTNAAEDSVAKIKAMAAGKDSTTIEKGEKEEKEEDEKNEK